MALRMQIIARTFSRGPGDDGLPPELSAIRARCLARGMLAGGAPSGGRPAASRSTAPTYVIGLAAPALRVRSDEAQAGRYTAFQTYPFAASLASGSTVRCLLGHKGQACLATNRDRLELAETDAGLWFRLKLGDTPLDAEVKAMLDAGRCGVSAGWETHRTERRTLPGGDVVEFIVEAELREISLVEDPAFKETAAWRDTCTDDLRTQITTGRVTGRASREAADRRFALALHRLDKALT